jgi:catechol 2,3-dioxygenase-like lactoylglutathione lyase family enzyme
VRECLLNVDHADRRSNILSSPPGRGSASAVICKYVALFVGDLRGAENAYGRLFGMDLLFREARLADDDWATLPVDKGWEDADAAGIELSMVALRRDEFVLALFQGAPQPGTVHEICFGLDADEIDAVWARLPKDSAPLAHSRGFLQFDDPFGFRWTLQELDTPFKSSGEIAGHWIEVGGA